MYTMTVVIIDHDGIAVQVYENNQKCILTQIAKDLRETLPIHIHMYASITEHKTYDISLNKNLG